MAEVLTFRNPKKLNIMQSFALTVCTKVDKLKGSKKKRYLLTKFATDSESVVRYLASPNDQTYKDMLRELTNTEIPIVDEVITIQDALIGKMYFTNVEFYETMGKSKTPIDFTMVQYMSEA